MTHILSITFTTERALHVVLTQQGSDSIVAEVFIPVTRTFDSDLIQEMRAFFELHAVDVQSLDIQLKEGALDKNTLPYRMAYTWKSAIESLKAREAAT